MFLAKIVDNVIIEYLNIDSDELIDGYVEVPESLPADADLRMYTDDFKLKDYDVLVSEGLIEPESEPEVSLAEEIRKLRDEGLATVDEYVMNPLRWGELSDVDKEELTRYRLGLLNVPQQTGFPQKTKWPDIPTILTK